MTDRMVLEIPEQHEDVGLLDYELELVLSKIRAVYNSKVVGTQIFEPGNENDYIHSHFTQLYKIDDSSEIEVGTANTTYGVNKTTHEVVIVHNIVEGPNNGYYLINFNGRLLDNYIDENEMFFSLKKKMQNIKTCPKELRGTIIGGPLCVTKKTTKSCQKQPIGISKDRSNLVTENLQGRAPICTLIAVANFKTIFEQCRNMDDVRAKFSGPELIQRLEDVKTLFGNRVIHKGVNQGKTVAAYIDERVEHLSNSKSFNIEIKQQMLTGQLASPTPGQIQLAQTTVTQESHLPQLQPPATPARQPVVSPTAAQGSHLPPLNQNPRQVPGSRPPVGGGGRINPSTHTRAPSMRLNLKRVSGLRPLAGVMVVPQRGDTPTQRSPILTRPSRLQRNINLGGHGFSSH